LSIKEVNNMWETLIGTYLPLLVGAGIALITALILSEKSHQHELADRKHERTIAACEIRLKEGEEITKIVSGEIFHLADVIKKMLCAESEKDLDCVLEALDELKKMIDETEKGKNIYVVSIKSLEDEKLTKAWEKTSGSFEAYINFNTKLSGLLKKDGIDLFLKDHDKHAEEDSILRKRYYSSAEEFFRRINELRSQ
jgi:hypothetical protein